MNFVWILACALSVAAEPIQFSSSGLSSAINLVQNGSAVDIQMQVAAPSSAAWSAVGVGSQMSDALMFVMYPSSNGQSVTISARTARGHVMPQVVPGIQTQVTNSSVGPDGNMMAEFTCYGCTRWSSGSLDTSSTNQPFIYALGPRDTLQSDDPNAAIEQHSSKGMFMGNAVTAMTESPQGGSGTASAPPINPGAGNTSVMEEKTPPRTLIIAHAVILCLVFYFLMPTAVVVLRLPFTSSFAFMGHAITQTISWALAIVGLGIAISFSRQSNSFSNYSAYHQRLGIAVVTITILQPLGGIIHHFMFKKSGKRSVVSYAHIVVGWMIIFLGMLNACFGLVLADNKNAAAGGLGAAGIVILLGTLAVSVWGNMRKAQTSGSRGNNAQMKQVHSGSASS